MKAKLYNLMNWAAIEGIVYSEEDQPGQILGAHKVGSTCLYQSFFPDAEKVSLIVEGKEKKITMEQADEEGFFAICVPGGTSSYYYEVKTKTGKKAIRKDPYAYDYDPLKEKTELYGDGILYDSWKYFGSISTEIEGQKGRGFCVYVPGAMRVSLVGSFCNFDGRVYPMNRIGGTEIFTLFFPEFKEEDSYLYEVKKKDGSIYYLNDPYSCVETKEGKTESKSFSELPYSWEDKLWEKKKIEKDQIQIYSIGKSEEKDSRFLKRIKKMGYTHISLPQYEPGDFFYSHPDGFMDSTELKNFVNHAHREDLGVILTWKGSDCRDLWKKEKRNFYISNILFLLEEYHFDGILFSGLEELFYLDYGKNQGQWTPNIYGGNENLEGIELIKHAVSIVKREHPQVLLIASIDALWWGVTEELSKGGLGFDFCIDIAFTKNVISYLNASQEERIYKKESLLQRIDYIKEQKFLMSLDKNYLECWKKEENKEEYLKLIKLISAYTTFLPGNRISGFLFPEDKKVEEALFFQKCNEMKKEIISMKKDEISNLCLLNREDREDGMIGFLKTLQEEEGSLLVLANISKEEKDNLLLEVPLEGKYELIFDTNVKAFGGEEMMLPEVCPVKEVRGEKISYQAEFKIRPYTVKVYRFLYYTEEEILKEAKNRADEICHQLEEEAKEKILRLRERKNKIGN